jgi:hypothetical protein
MVVVVQPGILQNLDLTETHKRLTRLPALPSKGPALSNRNLTWILVDQTRPFIISSDVDIYRLLNHNNADPSRRQRAWLRGSNQTELQLVLDK